MGASKSQLINQNLTKDNYLDTVLLYLNSQDTFDEAANNILMKESGKSLYNEIVNLNSKSQSPFRYFLKKRTPPIKSTANRTLHFSSLLRASTKFEKGAVLGFVVSTSTKSPRISARLASLMAEQAQLIVTKRDLRQLEEGKNYIVTKLDEITESLIEIEKEMLLIRKKSAGPISKKGISENLTNFNGIKSDLEENKIKLEQNEKLIKSITQNLKAQRKQLDSSRPDLPALTILKRQLVALEARKKGLIAEGMSEQSSQVLALEEEIENTRSQLPKEFQNDSSLFKDDSVEFIEDNTNPEIRLSELRKENWLLKARINAATKLLVAERISKESVPEDEQKYYALNKRLEMKYLLFGELSKQLFNIDVSRISIQNRIIQIETPKPMYSIRKPSLFPLVPMTLILSLVFAILVASIIEHFDPIVVNTQDFPGFNYVSLGNIPLLKEALKFKTKKTKESFLKSLIFKHRLDIPQTIPFKRIRTRLLHLDRNSSNHTKIISIHSTHSGDGKSFVTGNLAASLAALNKKVLIVDTDLRKKAISREFTSKDSKGLSNFLEGSSKSKIEELILPNIQPYLDLLPSGPPAVNSTELINSTKFSDALKHLKNQYDFIFLDNAPFLALPDSEIVAIHSDLILIVASSNKTKVHDLATMLDHFLSSGEQTIGMILNRSHSKNQLYYYYGSPKEEPSRIKVA